MQQDAALKQKVQELSDALKAEGLWKRRQPDWVCNYRGEHEMGEADFFEWLQFVYLPNRLLSRSHPATESGENYITLQAKKFASEKLVNHTIVRLLVELDALT